MKTKLLACLLVAFATAVTFQASFADGLLKHQHRTPPVCEPGYKIVEEVVYQDVVKYVCKQVQEYKKKWVYSTIDEPYCTQGCGVHGNCDNWKGPYCRQLLVKREILLPCPTTKCVTEAVVERVPVVVYTKVPCAPGEVAPPAYMPPANGKSEVLQAKPLPVDNKQK